MSYHSILLAHCFLKIIFFGSFRLFIGRGFFQWHKTNLFLGVVLVVLFFLWKPSLFFSEIVYFWTTHFIGRTILNSIFLRSIRRSIFIIWISMFILNIFRTSFPKSSKIFWMMIFLQPTFLGYLVFFKDFFTDGTFQDWVGFFDPYF